MSQETGTSRSTVVRVLRSGAISSAVTMVLSLTVIPFVLRGASLETYGAWATLSGLLAIARLSEGGIPTEVARRVAAAEGRGDRDGARVVVRQALTVMCGIALVMVAVAVVVAVVGIPVLFAGTVGDELRTLRLVWLATMAVLVVSLLLATWFATLGGLQRSDFGAYTAVLGALASAVVTVALVHLGLGIWSLLLGSVANSIVAWTGPVRGMRTLRPEIVPVPGRVSWGDARGLLAASSFLVVASLAQIADRQVDKLVLTRVSGSDAAGVFQIAASLSTQPLLLAALPATLLLAAAAELSATSPERLERLRGDSERASYAIGLLVAAAIVVFAPGFVGLWLGPSYDAVADVTQVLAVAAVPGVLASPMYYYAMGRGWHSAVVQASVASLLVNIAGSVVLTPRLGPIGAALGSLCAAAASLSVLYAVARRRDPRTTLARAWRPLVVLTALAAGSLVLLPEAGSWTVLVLQGVVWVAAASALLALVKALPVRISREGRALRVRFIKINLMKP